jgi:hypothetical protein
MQPYKKAKIFLFSQRSLLDSARPTTFPDRTTAIRLCGEQCLGGIRTFALPLVGPMVTRVSEPPYILYLIEVNPLAYNIEYSLWSLIHRTLRAHADEALK